MNRLPPLSTAVIVLLIACGSASANDGAGGATDPLAVKPTAAAVIASSDEFDFRYMPDVTLSDVEWDVEVDYATGDLGAVFDNYDAELGARGFTRTSVDRGNDDVEAEYDDATAGLEIELDVELDGGRVEVDLDIDAFDGPFPEGFTLTEFSGLDVPFYPDAEVVDVEWDFDFDHPAAELDAVFDYYDQHLQSLGWQQVELDDGDDDEFEAEYGKDGVYLELEVETGVEVEIEVNKLRFYVN